ncbi:unnamed protein product, partial [Effrenium voratum]
RYIADPLCGIKTSVGFTKSLLKALISAASREVLERLPQDLPVLLVYGSRDPVTENDLGAHSADQIEAQMKAAGRSITKRICYVGARHEILLARGHASRPSPITPLGHGQGCPLQEVCEPPGPVRRGRQAGRDILCGAVRLGSGAAQEPFMSGSFVGCGLWGFNPALRPMCAMVKDTTTWGPGLPGRIV